MEGATVERVIVRDPRLRWPVRADLDRVLAGRPLRSIGRRAKYLLFRFDHGTLIVHLGMSGSLRVSRQDEPPGPWDHVDVLAGGRLMRLRDPRRFGAVLWHTGPVESHPLLRGLGVEPLSDDFSGRVLHRAAQGRRVPVKQLLMDHSVVVGIGNIYASESLFRASIRPGVPAGRVSLSRYERLADAARSTLNDALRAGGSTLRDFVGGDGRAGYFQQQYFVYGRAGLACRVCGRAVRKLTQGQRSTYYCAQCQR